MPDPIFFSFCAAKWLPRLTRNQSDVACPNPCHIPRGPCRTLFFFYVLRFVARLMQNGIKIGARRLENRSRRLQNRPRRAPKATPETKKSTPEALGGILGCLGRLLGGPRGVLGCSFVRKCSILEVQNRPKSEVFPYFLKFSDFSCF